jgi:uncharacterized protein YifN (PemK superfamily)
LLRFFQYYALQILEVVIKSRWKVLPREQCEGESFTCIPVQQARPDLSLARQMDRDFINYHLFPGIKKFIVGLVIKMSSSDTLQQQKVYVGKLNMILVQVSALT